MKQILPLCFFLIVLHVKTSFGQTSQISFGTTGISENFYDTKFDPTDGGTISVGYRNNGTGNANDLFFVRTNAAHQVLWQKSIPNAGDDYFYKVIVCADGDYLATGQIFRSGVRRGIICKISKESGNIIWSKISAVSSVGEIFWDVLETTTGNIILAGANNFTTSATNSFLVSLDQDGNTNWSKTSTSTNADEFRNVAQLPNGNLIVVGFYNPISSSYPCTILEVLESTGAIVNEQTYQISRSISENPNFLNSLWSTEIFTRNSEILIGFFAFEGFGSESSYTVLKYDRNTNNLTGHIYEHTGAGNLTGATFHALSENDYIFSSSYGNPVETYVMRVTNDNVVRDAKISAATGTVFNSDVLNTNLTLAGNYGIATLDAYEFFSPITIPITTTPCDIPNATTLIRYPVTLFGTIDAPISLSNSTAMADVSLSIETPTYSVVDICGLILPVKLTSFSASYNSEKNNSNLKWSTSSEYNSHYFDIERSLDGSRFVGIGQVNAAGESNTNVSYQFIDEHPVEGRNYYRLKQVDKDGKFQFSDIKTITVPRYKNGFAIGPNPTNGFVNIDAPSFRNQLLAYQLIDINGKIFQQGSFMMGTTNNTIQLPVVAKGMYYLKISVKSKTVHTEKILIQ